MTGWEIDILDISDFEGKPTKETAKPVVENVADLKLDKKLVKSLTDANLALVEQLKGLTKKDLAEIDGIDEDGAKAVFDALKKVA